MKHARTDYDQRIQDSARLIPDGEPVLLIRGQDSLAVPVIETWLRGAEQAGVAPELIASVERHRTRVIEWQADHGNKVPDAPEGALG